MKTPKSVSAKKNLTKKETENTPPKSEPEVSTPKTAEAKATPPVGAKTVKKSAKKTTKPAPKPETSKDDENVLTSNPTQESGDSKPASSKSTEKKVDTDNKQKPAKVDGKQNKESKGETNGIEHAKESETTDMHKVEENPVENLAGESEHGTEGEDEEDKFEEHEIDEYEQDELLETEEAEEDTRQMEEEQLQMSNVLKERKLKKAQEVFVGGLDRDAVEDDLKKVFEKIGEVVEVRLHKNPQTNKNKGFAFVKFANQEQASRALAEMKSPVIRGKQCGIAPSEDNDTLFLGNICNTWTKEAIKRKLKEYGVEGVENITLVADAQHEGLSRGFAFVEFSCHADAMLAYKRLQKPDAIFGHPERTAKVAFAEPIREPDPEIMAQVKSVFVDGLPPHWDEDRVRDQFKVYGEIEQIVLARNMATAKRKDFGFVDFTTHETAVGCIEGVNNTELVDGKTKIKLRARLSNPLPKTQAVKGGMRGGFRIRHPAFGFGRGFAQARHPLERMGGRVGFERGRAFHPRGRGRTGRSFHAEFHGFGGRRPFRGRGGRRGSFGGRYFVGGRGDISRFDPAVPGAHEFSHADPLEGHTLPEEDYGRSFGSRVFSDDSYVYDGGVGGLKRPFSMIDQESAYLESGSRLRPRYDFLDPVSRRTHSRDTIGTASGLYSRDYSASDYGSRAYSSLYEGEYPVGRRYYY